METLTLEINNPTTLQVIAAAAARQGVTTQDYARRLLETALYAAEAANGTSTSASAPAPEFSEAELQAADERLFAFSGAVHSGDPHSCDNERIDADLARAYGDDHAALYQPKA